MSTPSDATPAPSPATDDVPSLLAALEDRLAATIEHQMSELRRSTLELSGRVDHLTQKVTTMEQNLSGEILDALLQVTRHLEAVQTASSWALLQELAGAGPAAEVRVEGPA